MKVLLTGGSGFVGEALVAELVALGCELVFLTRSPASMRMRYGEDHTYYYWDALLGRPDAQVFDGVAVIVNLMGEGIADKRWTKTQKEKIRHSRLVGTRFLVEGAMRYAPSLRTFISASAVGYYDHLGEGPFDETSLPSTGFLGQLCQDWEREVRVISEGGTVRTVIFRLGVVLGDGGGALKKMLPLIRAGLGGVLGSGKQWMNWIHRMDLVRLMVAGIQDTAYEGVYNAVSPGNVQNDLFVKTLGRLLNRPIFLRVSSCVLKVVLGELSQTLLYGQPVVSCRLASLGFTFCYPDITRALTEILSSSSSSS